MVHCRRTAAVAKLIAHQLFLPSEEKDLLCDACLLHHRSLGLFAPKSMERLLTPYPPRPLPYPHSRGVPVYRCSDAT